MISTQTFYQQLQGALDDKAARVLADLLSAIYEDLQQSVTREDLDHLKVHISKETSRLDAALEKLAQAQARTDASIAKLTEAQERTEARQGRLEETVTSEVSRLDAALAKLAEAQERTEARLGRLEETVTSEVSRLDAALAKLAEAQERAEARLEALEQTVERLAIAQERTEKTLNRVIDRVGKLEGSMLEMRFRELAPSFLGRHLRRSKVIPTASLIEELEKSLSDEEIDRVLLLDAIVQGKTPVGKEITLACEVSCKADPYDFVRALDRAALLRKVGLQALPLVYCELIDKPDYDAATSSGVAILKSGEPFLGFESSANAFGVGV